MEDVLGLLSPCFISKLQQNFYHFCQQKLNVPIEGSISSPQELAYEWSICLFCKKICRQLTFLSHQIFFNFLFFWADFSSQLQNECYDTQKIQSALVCSEQNIALWLHLSALTKQSNKLLLQEVWSNLCNILLRKAYCYFSAVIIEKYTLNTLLLFSIHRVYNKHVRSCQMQ